MAATKLQLNINKSYYNGAGAWANVPSTPTDVCCLGTWSALAGLLVSIHIHPPPKQFLALPFILTVKCTSLCIGAMNDPNCLFLFSYQASRSFQEPATRVSEESRGGVYYVQLFFNSMASKLKAGISILYQNCVYCRPLIMFCPVS